MQARRDVGEPPLQVGHGVHEQDDDIDRRQAEVVRDPHVICRIDMPLDVAGRIEQTHLVPGLDPERLR